MTTIALVGAGPGLGAAIATRFAGEGFDVALISRSPDKTQALAAELSARGPTVRHYAADVRVADGLRQALSRAGTELGPVEVVTYSPIPQAEFLRPLLDTGPENWEAALEFSLFGPVAVVGQVLEGMRSAGRGAILFVNGGSAARPNARVAGTSVAFAAESVYAQMLHEVLRLEGIHVGQLIVPGAITPGHPTHDPGVLADLVWAMYARRGEFRVYAEPMDG